EVEDRAESESDHRDDIGDDISDDQCQLEVQGLAALFANERRRVLLHEEDDQRNDPCGEDCADLRPCGRGAFGRRRLPEPGGAGTVRLRRQGLRSERSGVRGGTRSVSLWSAVSLLTAVAGL